MSTAVGTAIDTAITALSSADQGVALKCWDAIAGVLDQAYGVVGQDDQATTADSTTSSSFVDASGYPTWTVTVPLTKTYLLDVDLDLYVQTSSAIAVFDVQVDGVSISGQPTNAQTVLIDPVLTTTRVHFIVKCALTAGSRTFKLRWKRSTGSGTLTVASSPSQFRCFTLRGA